MANEKNLNHKLTADELRKGGLASGRVRKEKKAFKDLAKTILSMRTSDDEMLAIAKAMGVDNPSNKQMVIIGLTLSAIKGNHNAFDRLLTLTGEDIAVNDGQEKEHTEFIKAIKNRNENK